MPILIPNSCTDLVSNADAQKAVDAIQRQIALDVAPFWFQSDTLHYVGDSQTEKPGDGDRIVKIVRTSSNQGALGSHWLDGTRPTGEVGAETCIGDGVSIWSCLSHEVLEMLVDPTACLCAQVGKLILALELCDRVEDSDATYTIDGIQVENFSTQNAFIDGAPGPWDFRKKCSSNIVLPNGYQLQIDPTNGQWSQITGMLARSSKRFAGESSRRAARMRRTGANPSSLILVAA